MTSLRLKCTGPAPVHRLRKIGGVAMALAFAAPLSFVVTTPAEAKPKPKAAATAQPAVLGNSVADFYAYRKDYPLWLASGAGDSAERLVDLLASAELDGLDPDRYGVATLRNAVQMARAGDFKMRQRVDHQLSQAFVAYVADMRRDPGGVIYVEPQLIPSAPQSRYLLNDVARASTPAKYLADMPWMNPIYVDLRKALASKRFEGESQREQLALNLDRARVLPATDRRYILVNAAQQQLFTYDNRRQVDHMRVVVGKAKNPTPMMAALVRFAALNPYWYVPPDLASERIAPNVLKQGMPYLDRLGYEVMSDWSPAAAIIDPKTIDWKSVAAGKTEIFVRQQPGPHNSMGRMKFMFPNEAGVYLHDNPERELFEQAARLYSGGCVRLEDAARLGKWLFGRDLVWEGAGTEERVPLEQPVPVYITYLTAMPQDDGSIAFFDDVYGRDKAKMASLEHAATDAGR